jgi:transposase InsO family protein
VQSCRACYLAKQTLTRRQAKMVQWHPLTRFHTVAVAITEISPTSRNGYGKVVVIRDLFTRLAVAVPVKEESASTIANTLFDRWISIFGPPRRLLSDQGKPFVSAMVKHLCERIGTEKIETSAYHPQTDGMVERYNRTLCEDLAKYVMDEENWDQHVAMATFRFNCSVSSATGLTPYYATFGVHAFEFDAGHGLELRLEEEPEDLPKALARIHQELLSAGHRSRGTAATYYDRAVKACSYNVGDRMLLYYPPGEIEQGRKPRVPWLGPYRVVARHSSVAYTIRSE